MNLPPDVLASIERLREQGCVREGPASVAPVMGNPITEVEFQQTLIDLARGYGWLIHAERPARTAKGWATPIQGDPGYQDITAVHPATRRVLIAELKVGKNQPTPSQAAWLSAWRLAAERTPNVSVFCLRPTDMEWVVAMLARPT